MSLVKKINENIIVFNGFSPRGIFPNQDIERLRQYPIIKEKWIRRFFTIPLNNQDITNEANQELQQAQDTVLQLISECIVLSDSSGNQTFMQKILGGGPDQLNFQNSLNKNPTGLTAVSQDGIVHLLVRFVDKSPQEDSSKSKIIYNPPNVGSIIGDYKDGRTTLFSPLDDLDGKILFSVEYNLCKFLKLSCTENLTSFEMEGKIPYVKNTNLIQHEEYPIEKRLLLYKTYPQLEKYIFGPEFPIFISWLMKQKEDNKHMTKYCRAVEKILKQNNFFIEK